MTQAIGFAPTALPTARAPFEIPSCPANALYETVGARFEFEQCAPDLHLEIRAVHRERQGCRFVTPDDLPRVRRRAHRRARNSPSEMFRAVRRVPPRRCVHRPFVHRQRPGDTGRAASRRERPIRTVSMRRRGGRTRPRPARGISPGVMASSVTVRSCNRPPPESPTECAASSTDGSLCSAGFAARLVTSARYCLGVSPVQRRNSRLK